MERDVRVSERGITDYEGILVLQNVDHREDSITGLSCPEKGYYLIVGFGKCFLKFGKETLDVLFRILFSENRAGARDNNFRYNSNYKVIR
jgi:hypothetical protein